MTLTSAGLVIKTQAELFAELVVAMRASPILNPDDLLDVDDPEESVLGAIAAIMSDQFADIQQVMQAIYASQYRASAEGASLDALAELIGATRIPAAGSRVDLSLTGVNGTIIPAGSRVRDADRPDVEWVTLDAVTIALGVASVEAQADVTGPISANTGTLDDIVTPVAGWATVTNAADAVRGVDVETDASLRLRMIDLLSTPGSSTLGAILAAVTAVAGVTQARAFENAGDSTNGYGVPPRNIEMVVSGGDDNEIAQAIYDNKAAGAGTYSATGDSGTATDVNGDSVTIEFSRPEAIDIYVYIEVVVDGSNPDVASEIQAAVAAYGDTHLAGAKVVRTKFFSSVYGVDSVDNVRKLGVGTSAGDTFGGAQDSSHTMTDVEMAFREQGVFDTARVEVVIVTE